jgi:hypothetical protein
MSLNLDTTVQCQTILRFHYSERQTQEQQLYIFCIFSVSYKSNLDYLGMESQIFTLLLLMVLFSY